MNSKKSVTAASSGFPNVFFGLLLCLLLCLALSGCSNLFSVINLNITAKNRLNRDAFYRALPVVVRVYTLKSPENFSDATFRELWHDDLKILGENKITRQEFTVVPGTTLQITIPRNPDAQYLGAVALFRHPLHNQWRAVIPIPVWTANLILSGNSISFNE